ncbi:hypothetical protein D3C72_1059420 [compost metagenome]
MLFVRFFVGLTLIVSLWGCSDATPEVSFFGKTKIDTTGELRETIVGSHTATAAGMQLKGTARVAERNISQSSNGQIVLKGWVR